jgi:dTDP-4-amino-4,6-dideoxygalactose transaminase
MRRIPFNRPFITGRELDHIRAVFGGGHLSGDGAFTRRCHAWLERQVGCARALLTHSCTAALEMAALLADIGPGDEVILPSFTFASTANAFVLRGGVPVFVDIRPDTLNIDETRIEAAITPRTRAVVVVHYAGVACAMDAIRAIADRHGLLVIEDAAHGLLAELQGRRLGSFGHLAALSFHETKNLISGEGGALLINEARLIERAEFIREKGTNRNQFFRGEVARYTWVDVGSSYLPSEILAAFLWAQFEAAAAITERRMAVWTRYHAGFEELEKLGRLRRPFVPRECRLNGHMYYLLMPDLEARTALIEALRRQGIQAVFHYVPLHSSPAGRKYGRSVGPLAETDAVSDRLVRLPLWVEMTGDDVERVVGAVTQSLAAPAR